MDDLATEGGGDTIEALDALSPIHRAVLVLHYLDDVPVRTIATMLDRSPVAVDSLLARARQSLSAQIDAEAGRP